MDGGTDLASILYLYLLFIYLPSLIGLHIFISELDPYGDFPLYMIVSYLCASWLVMLAFRRADKV